MNQHADLTPAGLSLTDTMRRPDLLLQERDLVILIAQGLSNAEIAQRLGVTPGVVAVALAQAMQKLKVRTRARVAVWAVEQRLYAPDRDVPG